MILEKKPVSLAQVKDYLKDIGEANKQLEDYIKSFARVSKADAQRIEAELNALNNSKIKDENIIKIIDLLPEDSEDINKIFHDVSLTEEESNTILSIVKK